MELQTPTQICLTNRHDKNTRLSLSCPLHSQRLLQKCKREQKASLQGTPNAVASKRFLFSPEHAIRLFCLVWSKQINSGEPLKIGSQL
jgi:hypothetical protein